MNMKVLIVIGTRPEAIKMAPIVKAMIRRPAAFDCCVCVTAQHRTLLDDVLTVFNIRPDYDLNVMAQGQNPSEVAGRVFVLLDPLIEAERTVFGLGHDGIGGYLLALWGIPQIIVEAVTFHHHPDQCRGESLGTPALVYVANFLAHEESGADDAERQSNCGELLADLGMLERLDAWRDAIRIKKD